MTEKKETGKNWKRTAYVWLAIYLVSLIPMIILGFYNFPCADDLGYSIYTRHAWIDTHSIFSVLEAACRKVAESYQTWQGTWSSIFFMALQPGIFGDQWYGITVILMTGVMSAAVFYLFHCIFVRCLGGRKAFSVAAASIVLVIAVQCMVDKTQAFFWYNGAVHYIFPQSTLLVLTGIVLTMGRITGKEKRKNSFLLGAGIVLTALIGGGNYVTGLECGIWLITAMLLFAGAGRKTWKKTAVFLGVWLVSFGINAAAPGNFVREAEFAYHPGVIRSILQSFYYCLDFVFNQWMGWEIIVLIVLIAPFIGKAVQEYSGNFRFRYPLLVPAYSFCILSSMFTPSVFASGIPGAGRIYNIIYLTHLILIVVNMIYLYGWYWRRYGEKKIAERDFFCYHAASFGAACFIFGITAAVNLDTYTSVSAAASLMSGEAEEYQKEQEKRLEILEDTDQPDAVLKEFSEKPYLLFYEDIEADPKNWKNLRMSDYYRKNTVCLINADISDAE